jgi:uroporphyrinogen-III synthase
MAKLIANFGGEPMLAPSMKEVPLQSNQAALDFAAALLAGRIDIVIFLTGVGTRALTRVVESKHSREQFVAALSKVTTVARGPKPVAALRELGVTVTVAVPEPNTWHEVLSALDATGMAVRGRTVAVQEYGLPNPELMAGLNERGARPRPVPVYEWELPDDLEPLRGAIRSVAAGSVDVALFTTSVQVRHLLLVAKEMGLENELRAALRRMMLGSIGPVTSEELRSHGLAVDFEPTHAKMGFLVKEAADRSAEVLAKKRS